MYTLFPHNLCLWFPVPEIFFISAISDFSCDMMPISLLHEVNNGNHLGELLHAQALTLGALAGAALVEYYDHKAGAKAS
ncbi:hypothetical protein E2542_SST30518 [Spatholobus suberectus]|nr:hypothetical protein E2542_SST30518 [Spatholobus suberectus]